MNFSYLAQQAYEHLQKAKHVLLVAHRKPDGDTLGSVTAMMGVLSHMGKRATAFCQDVPGEQWKYLPRIEEFVSVCDSVLADTIDCVIIFDSSDLPYSGFDTYLSRFSKKPLLMQFDHHAKNLYFADVNVVVADAASTTEVLGRFFDSCHIVIDRQIATSLLTGVVTDTTAFTNPATTGFAVAFAGQCLLRGARFPEVVRETLLNKGAGEMKLWGRMLERLTKSSRYDCAVTVVTQRDVAECHAEEESLEGVANFLNSLGETKAVLILKELDGGKIKGSLRTTREDVDVGKFALLFGGGGHRKSSGFTIEGKLVETPTGWVIQ